jgi:hypothetical protein
MAADEQKRNKKHLYSRLTAPVSSTKMKAMDTNESINMYHC